LALPVVYVKCCQNLPLLPCDEALHVSISCVVVNKSI
jgi:hypothetical protein